MADVAAMDCGSENRSNVGYRLLEGVKNWISVTATTTNQESTPMIPEHTTDASEDNTTNNSRVVSNRVTIDSQPDKWVPKETLTVKVRRFVIKKHIPTETEEPAPDFVLPLVSKNVTQKRVRISSREKATPVIIDED